MIMGSPSNFNTMKSKLEDHIINHFSPFNSINEPTGDWNPLVNSTKIVSYDPSGKFCAFVKLNNIIELWNINSVLVPMISVVDCNKYIDKDWRNPRVGWRGRRAAGRPEK